MAGFPEMCWKMIVSGANFVVGTIQGMRMDTYRFLASLPPGRSWEMPKIMAMGAYPRTIRELGCAGITSSAPGEASHKQLKLAALHSNRHQDTHLEQVSSKHASYCFRSL